MKTGTSLYLGTPIERNLDILEKAKKAGVSYLFTSLQIGEERIEEKKDILIQLLNACKLTGIPCIADVSPRTKELLQLQSFVELKKLGIGALRLDYGFSIQEITQLSKQFQLVLNASTVSKEEIDGWEKAGIDRNQLIACHNYYPKEYTGLSKVSVESINRQMKSLGLKTMGFVPGDKTLRGPLYTGLPTVESHREQKEKILLHMLELHFDCDCDIVMIGDVDISETAWRQVELLGDDIVEVKSKFNPSYEYFFGTVHHDRMDSSDYLFRSVESRQKKTHIVPHNCVERGAGSICVSNANYLRYEGELEIPRVSLPADDRINVVGNIEESECAYLPFLKSGMGIQFKKS